MRPPLGLRILRAVAHSAKSNPARALCLLGTPEGASCHMYHLLMSQFLKLGALLNLVTSMKATVQCTLVGEYTGLERLTTLDFMVSIN